MPVGRTLWLLLFAFAVRLTSAEEPPAPAGPERFEAEVAALEALDAAAADPEGGVLLLGSSSIVMWESAAADLAPYPVIRRGFGGANFEDLAHFAERLVKPHSFRAAVVFVANDVTGEGHDHAPDEVKARFVRVAEVLRAREPLAPIVCCDVRPTPLREPVWKQTEAVNAALREACNERAGVHYLDTAAAYWGEDGKARTDVYREDRLHLNEAGYALWSGQIKRELDRVLGDASAVRMPVYGSESETPAPRTLAEVEALHAGSDAEAVAADRAQRPLRVVLAAGPKDHDAGEHDYPAWLDAWSRLLPRAVGTEVRAAWEFPSAGDAAWADVMVFYQRGSWDDSRAAVIDPFLARGGGLAYLHWAVDGRGGEADMARRIGLSARGGGIKYRHGWLDLDFAPGAGHPIARNFHRLRLNDESYWELTGDASRLGLLGTGVEAGAPQPLFWAFEPPGGGRVFVSIPGHNMWTFDDPAFRTLVLRGVAWAGGRSIDRFNGLATAGARVE